MGSEFSLVNASYYYQARTTYCPQMFLDIKKYLNLDSRSKILDVGAGTGQASWPFIQEGYPTVLVEPSKQFTIFLNQRYYDINTVKVVNRSFEDICVKSIYDIVLSGTAFHWIDPQIKYKKAYHMLKDDGHLVLFWSRPDWESCPVWKDIMIIKEKYSSNQSLIFEESLINAFRLQRSEIRESKIFECIYSRIYKYDKKYKENDICNLFDTFVDIMELPVSKKKAFINDLKDYLHEHTMPLSLTYYVDLYICKKIA